MKIVFLIFLISDLMFFSCSTPSDKFIEIRKKNFTISVPENLIQPSDAEEGSILNLTEDTSDFLNGLSVVVYDDSIIKDLDTISLYDYYYYVSDNILDETTGEGNLQTPEDTTVNGYKSLFFTICGLYNSNNTNENVCFYTGIFQGEKNFYEVTVSCSEKRKQNYLPAIQKILNSFKETSMIK